MILTPIPLLKGSNAFIAKKRKSKQKILVVKTIWEVRCVQLLKSDQSDAAAGPGRAGPGSLLVGHWHLNVCHLLFESIGLNSISGLRSALFASTNTAQPCLLLLDICGSTTIAFLPTQPIFSVFWSVHHGKSFNIYFPFWWSDLKHPYVVAVGKNGKLTTLTRMFSVNAISLQQIRLKLTITFLFFTIGWPEPL